MKKRDLTELASLLVERYPRAVVAESLDKLKDIGFEFATRSGLTISIADVKTPESKAALLEHFEAEADKVEGQYERGVITDDERRQKEIEVWSEATAKVRDAMQAEMRLEKFNPIDMMVGSGARGNVMQVQQIAGMRGLVANPRVVRSSRGRSSRTSVRASPSSSTSSPPTVPARGSPTPPSAPPTPAT